MSYQQQEQIESSTLAAMCRQECGSYKCTDYLNNSRAASPSDVLDQLFHAKNTATMPPEDIQTCMNNRSKMASWCMTLMDACTLSRETVSIAMNLLDRFLATPEGCDCIEDSAAFQLAVMTALYSSIKVHEEKAISPSVLSSISRGFYTPEDMEEMEVKMLNALQWRINVPTPLAFVREFLHLLPNNVNKDQLLSLAQVQTEMSVADYSFVTTNASSIGFAALVNALDVLGMDVRSLTNPIVNLGLIDTQEVFQIQGTLYVTVANLTHLRTQRIARPSLTSSVNKQREQSAHSLSPRAVCEQ